MPNSLSDNVARLRAAKTAIGNAIVKRGGEIGENDGLEDFPQAILDIPKTGYEHGGVNFFDLDGIILHSFTSEEFLKLTEMPENPDHTYEWLVAQGWNWTLADAKAYVAKYGALNIGQHYTTPDDKTAIDVHLPEGCLNPQLGLFVNGSVRVEWGDGTEDTLTNTGMKYTYASHQYAEPGQYYILLTVTGSAEIKSTNGANVFFCKGGKGTGKPGNESKAYSNCIVDVHLGANIDIGKFAFFRCYSMKHISIPSTVRSINESSFRWDSTLESIVIPHGVTELGANTFEGCYGMRFLSVPNTIESIGDRCFAECYSLICATFPETMTSVGSSAFADTPSCDVLLTPGADAIPYEFIIRNRTMAAFSVPEGVTALGDYAFSNAYGLKDITLPSTLLSAGVSCFTDCQALNSISIPDTFTTLGESMFNNCTALQQVNIPSGATTIPTKCFRQCYSMTKIEIPASIETIAAEAFTTCSGLGIIKFLGSTPPTVANANAFTSLEYSCKLLVPEGSLAAYTSAQNYPDPTKYTYEEY